MYEVDLTDFIFLVFPFCHLIVTTFLKLLNYSVAMFDTWYAAKQNKYSAEIFDNFSQTFQWNKIKCWT